MNKTVTGQPHDLYSYHSLHSLAKKFYSTFILLLIFCSNDLQAQRTDSLPGGGQQKNGVVPMPDSMYGARPVYKINTLRSGIFSIVATAANLYAIPTIIHGKRDMTDAELDALNPLSPNSIERWALKQNPANRESFSKASDIALPTIIFSAAALGFDKHIRKDWAKLLLMYYEMHAFTFALYDFSPFGPAFQNKLRPVTYYTYFPREERLRGNNRNSLYSGHVASAAASTFFMAKVYSDYHPEIGNKRFLLYGLASLPPLVEGYLRVKALAHFPSDVVVGFVIGAVCGIGLPEMHRKKAQSLRFGLYSNGESNGLKLAWNFTKKQKALNEPVCLRK
ncbi:MAG TPA: phosphatase PAP2 family protein [Flavisolibacter sp.]|nr:phosphatase PAP2 family protein [Flavisolibacter sp.]